MKEIEYLQLKIEQRKKARQALETGFQRGDAGKHKRNYLCLECRKAYNYTAVYNDGEYYNPKRFCPIHKTRLLTYFGHVPRKSNKTKWAKLKTRS